VGRVLSGQAADLNLMCRGNDTARDVTIIEIALDSRKALT